MAIKAIFVAFGDAEPPEPVLETAFMLGRDLSAHLDVLHVKSDPRDNLLFATEEMSESHLQECLRAADEVAERARTVRTLFDTCCARYGVTAIDEDCPAGLASATWVAQSSRWEEILARRGRIADMIMVPRPVAKNTESAHAIFETALRETGHPVLVTPPTAPSVLGRTVAVAWNGSTESARAVGAAMPFIEKAERLVVLTAESNHTRATAAAEAAGYLALHGLAAETRVFSKSAHPSVGEALLEHCRTLGADLLVMGAYTHSRLREMLLGGVTRYMLDHAELPVLMAH